jgi:ankyrin repeat protein
MFDDEEYLESRNFPIFHKIVLGLSPADLRAHLQISTASIDDQDADGRTALSWAAGKGDLSAVEVLLEFGADSSISSRRQQTALSWAAQGAGENRCAIAKALLDHGCQANQHDHQHRVPLLNAAGDKDEPSLLALLLNAGTNVDWRDCHQRTALGFCAKMNRPDNAQFLLSRGADASLADHWGFTPLLEAIYQNHHEVLDVLLGFDDVLPDLVTAKGMTVLHVAAVYADEWTLKRLCSADLRRLRRDDEDGNGATAAELFAKREDAANKGLSMTFLDLLDTTDEPDFEDAMESL